MLLTAENCDLQALIQRGEHFTRGVLVSLNPGAYLDSQGIDLAMACKALPAKPVVWARLRASPGRTNLWKLYAWTDDTGLIEAASWLDRGVAYNWGGRAVYKPGAEAIGCVDLSCIPVSLANTPQARYHLAKALFPPVKVHP